MPMKQQRTEADGGKEDREGEKVWVGRREQLQGRKEGKRRR